MILFKTYSNYYNIISNNNCLFFFLQNENITRLKINNNPFAKGFRETGQSRCKRKLQTSEDQSSLDSHDEEGNVSSSDCEAGQLEDSPSECSANKRTRRSPSDTESVIDDSGISSSGGATPPPSSSSSSSQLLSSETLSEVNYRVSSSSSSSSASSASSSPAPTEHAGNQTRLYRPWADSPSSPCRSSQEQTLPVVTTPMQYHSLFFPLLSPEQQLAALEYSRRLDAAFLVPVAICVFRAIGRIRALETEGALGAGGRVLTHD